MQHKGFYGFVGGHDRYGSDRRTAARGFCACGGGVTGISESPGTGGWTTGPGAGAGKASVGGTAMPPAAVSPAATSAVPVAKRTLASGQGGGGSGVDRAKGSLANAYA